MTDYRAFTVNSIGTIMVVEVSDGMSESYDILDAAGLANESRLNLCLAAEMGGQSPTEIAHKLVRLYKELK